MSEASTPDENVKTLSVRLDLDIYRNLSHYAFDHGVTRTAVIRQALAAYLAIDLEAAKPVTTEKDDGQSESKGKKRSTRAKGK